MGVVLACLTNDWDTAVKVVPLISVVLALYAGYIINLENVWYGLRFL